jgi:hypothetical protein
MTALPRLQQALVDAARPRSRPRRAPRVLAGAAALTAAAAFAVAVVPRDDDPERPVTAPVRVAVGEPVTPAEPAGNPPEGRIELRATDPESGRTLVGMYFTYQGDPCWEVGGERAYREYPVREGGSCVKTTGGMLPVPFTYGVSQARKQSITVDGMAGAEVERLEVDGPGGRRDLPLSEHGGWFAAYPASSRGTVTITAHLRDGRTDVKQVEIPIEHPPAPPPDPLVKKLSARPADVEAIAVTPAVGDPGTTFELAVPPADRGGLYAVSLAGPAGPGCEGELGETFGIVADERRGRIRPLPPHRQAPFMAVDEPGYDEALRTAPWCPGRYRVKVRRIERNEKGEGRTVARLEFEVREPAP